MILASGASLAWGGSDFLAGLGTRRMGLLAVLYISQVLGLLFLLPALIVAGQPQPDLSYCGLGVLAGAFNAVALGAFYRGLALGPIGLVAPIAAAEAVIPVTFGLLRGDRPSSAAMLGITVALIGIVLAAEPSVERGGAVQHKWRAPGAICAIVAAVFFGLFVVTLKGATSGGALWAVALSRVTTVLLLGAAVPITRTGLSVSRRDMSFLFAIGALDMGASTLFAFAARHSELSVIGVLGSFYPVVTILLAGVFLREKLGTLQRLGTLGALAGVALITVA